jgi:hypothetical protein
MSTRTVWAMGASLAMAAALCASDARAAVLPRHRGRVDRPRGNEDRYRRFSDQSNVR